MSISWQTLVNRIEITLAHFEPEIGQGIIAHPDGAQSGVLMGTHSGDVIVGGTGDDTFVGMGGTDSFAGFEGEDTVDYTGSTTFVSIDFTDATVNDGDMLDSIEYLILTDFNDRVNGDTADNHLFGGDGVDTLYGRTGRDHLHGEVGEDKLHGGKHKDRIYGGEDDDRVYGDWGHDYLKGQNGDDLIRGATGDDRLFGGDGDDILEGEEGDDYLSGGKGSDQFHFTEGHDFIRDMNVDMDSLYLSTDLWGGDSLTRQQILNRYGEWNGDKYVLAFDANNSLTFEGITDPESLKAIMEF